VAGLARTSTPIALALTLACAAVPAAFAQTSTTPAMPPGGSTYTAPPVIKKVRCVQGCATRKRLRGGSTARLEGRSLGGVTKVTFHGSVGRRDDRRVAVKPGTSTRRLRVPVPLSAVSGPVSVQVSRSVKSRRTRSVKILPAPEIEPNPVLSPVPGTGANGTPRLETATSRTKFYFAGSNVRFSWRVTHPTAVNVTVDLLRTDGTVAHTWAVGASAPGQTRSLIWRGTLAGRPAPAGRYSFRLNAASSTGARARSSSTAPSGSRDAFDLLPHIFPVRGRHNFGQSGARFGAGRGGRSHQGQDVMAKCGTRLVAARGGKVKAKGYQRAAGNYVVITGDRTGQDYAYMHLTEPSAFDRGDRVLTGQRIGTVGDTGNARGCHLHFELWRKPGWYSGGRAFNPLPALREWDSYS
jgi:murein DD-endopeptidase MepM/ murein hydrolase activator NlpD